ncbi:response regulator receiver and ANTAR domain protein [Ferrithrix thermotolerans DSM 19514]|uniref:Response regulator receiver and ANTAR domain protein n=1 Tax=Ferrithrix thermotolerans DSM 19514 TaxID=1121881 RepID=A0A1M4SDD5_9ACTN|nr:response regulator [Ferrithrix thermotolerans]SHE30172.1 response regulator receiver and ANTAR domain protein [Ferrithrix thermotolerans DSM 19514]
MPVRVLLAEDEAIVRLDLKEMLRVEGYDVVGDFGAGDEALKFAMEQKPDIAVLDVKMPGMDGIEVAKILRKEKICATLILTAFSQRSLVEAAREAGVMAYLVKPFQASELVPSIELAIARYNEAIALEEELDLVRDEKTALEFAVETRKALDRAKGKLMEAYALTEPQAFRFIQKTAMDRRLSMREVANAVIDGELVPSETADR